MKIQEITRIEFRNYLLNKKDNINWFYWHINSNLNDFRTFKITQKKHLVGVFCYENINSPFVDLYIDKKYRRLGYGKCVTKHLSNIFKKVQFKVNTNNKQSINFYEFLLSKNILLSKEVNGDFIKYYT